MTVQIREYEMLPVIVDIVLGGFEPLQRRPQSRVEIKPAESTD